MIYILFGAALSGCFTLCFYTGAVTPPTRQEVPRRNYWTGFPGLYSRFYAWLLRRMPSERQRLLAVTILAGGLCGLAAVAFHLSIMGLETLFIDRANAAPGIAGYGGPSFPPRSGAWLPASALPTLLPLLRVAAFRR